MRKAFIGCFTFTFLASPLHAEETGSNFSSGLAKGAGGVPLIK
jgi:hypothetical protein